MFRYIYLFTGEPPLAKRMAFTGDVLMRKILLIGLVLIALLCAMPAAVSAAGSDTVVVNGNIAITMEVNAAATSIEFGSMAAGTEESGNSNINVVTTSTNWNVRASDERTTTKGHLYKAGTPDVPLTNALRFGKTTDPMGTLVTDLANFMQGTTAGSFNQVAYVEQDIASADPQGTYTMTITFTGTAS